MSENEVIPWFQEVNKVALPEGFGEATLRLLDRVAGLCMSAGESASDVRHRILMQTDRLARRIGPGIGIRSPADLAAISGLIGEIATILAVLARNCPSQREEGQS